VFGLAIRSVERSARNGFIRDLHRRWVYAVELASRFLYEQDERRGKKNCTMTDIRLCLNSADQRTQFDNIAYSNVLVKSLVLALHSCKREHGTLHRHVCAPHVAKHFTPVQARPNFRWRPTVNVTCQMSTTSSTTASMTRQYQTPIQEKSRWPRNDIKRHEKHPSKVDI
jgi:hypothetical protein